ncbi:MAG: nuclear transport factor 2 family protein [Candidatus Eremiobacteraeota bacterium]|nr:nuclear transport factor 2 family protein [Candidatus Eremiobacteraeota bacterium]
MTLRALIDELVVAWTANDAYRASAFFAPDGVYHESGREALRGRDAIFEAFCRFFRDGPPWRFAIDEVVAEGDCGAVAYRFSVKADGGDWQERAGCAFVRRRDGLIAYWREYHG